MLDHTIKNNVIVSKTSALIYAKYTYAIHYYYKNEWHIKTRRSAALAKLFIHFDFIIQNQFQLNTVGLSFWLL